MAGLANGRGVMKLVAIEANAHGGHAGSLRHRGHLRDLAVACIALNAGGEVLSVRPVHAGGDSIDAHPRDALARFCVGSELLDGGHFRCDGFVAGHARARRREGHQIARLRVGVAHATLQADRQMSPVAVGNRLHGRRVFSDVRGHFLLRLRRPRRLLCFCVKHLEEQNGNQCGSSKPGNS